MFFVVCLFAPAISKMKLNQWKTTRAILFFYFIFGFYLVLFIKYSDSLLNGL